MSRLIWCLLLVCLFLGSAMASAQNAEKEQAAIAVAEQWLELVDASRYGQSWKQAAEIFRNGVAKTDWRDSMRAVRAPLGRLKSRKVLRADYRTSLPGAPDGEYVVVQFQASFANKQAAVETVTPLLEKDGNWRVSGYYIR